MTRRRRKELERQKQIRLQDVVLRRKRMCDEKRRYETEIEAEAWGKIFNVTTYKHNPRNFRAYWCPHCNNYHLTSRPDFDKVVA